MTNIKFSHVLQWLARTHITISGYAPLTFGPHAYQGTHHSRLAAQAGGGQGCPLGVPPLLARWEMAGGFLGQHGMHALHAATPAWHTRPACGHTLATPAGDVPG